MRKGVEEMIEVKTLSDLDGAERYGSCMSCGINSVEDDKMIRVYVLMHHTIGGYQGTSLCLCSKCKKVLKEMLK